jgi:hypothetical protein
MQHLPREDEGEAATEIAAEDLHGMTLAQAFRRFVLDDPEVAAVGQLVISQHGHADVFLRGQCPGPFVDYRWPLATNPSELAHHFVWVIIHFVGEPDPGPPPIIEHAARLLVGRIERLKRALVGGRVIARGTFAASGTVLEIDSLQWMRENMWIDVVNSDLCSGIYARAEPVWTGVSLIATSKGRIARPVRREGAHSAALPLSVEQSSVEQAIQALWPHGMPLGVPVKARNQMIINWQRQNGCAVVSDRTIQRYLAALRGG